MAKTMANLGVVPQSFFLRL